MSDHRPERDGYVKAKQAAAMQRPLPKRFYTGAAAGPANDGWRLTLDGKVAKTPKRRELAVASQAVAEAIAREWAAQTTHVDPTTMPLTTLVCSALDTVADNRADIIDEIVAFAGSDLLCYRAAGPDGLVAMQTRHWDPPLAWAEQTLGARFTIATGLMPVAQPPSAQNGIRSAIEPLDALPLAAVHVLTTLTGSAVLAVATAHQALDADAMWTAAHVDEDWQIAHWGEDHEAATRRAKRKGEADAAVFVLRDARGVSG